jgi:hypothetical protein
MIPMRETNAFSTNLVLATPELTACEETTACEKQVMVIRLAGQIVDIITASHTKARSEPQTTDRQMKSDLTIFFVFNSSHSCHPFPNADATRPSRVEMVYIQGIIHALIQTPLRCK